MPTLDTSRSRLTYADLLLLPEDNRRVELIDGRLTVTASPTVRHQRIVQRIFVAIELYLREEPIGEVFGVSLDTLLSLHDVLQPDVLFVRHERRSLFSEANLQGAPDLAVEVLSPSTRHRDLGVKLELYERHGVEEYWLVDPEAKSVEVRRRVTGRLARVAELAAVEDRLTSPLLPGLEIVLDELFETT